MSLYSHGRWTRFLRSAPMSWPQAKKNRSNLSEGLRFKNKDLWMKEELEELLQRVSRTTSPRMRLLFLLLISSSFLMNHLLTFPVLSLILPTELFSLEKSRQVANATLPEFHSPSQKKPFCQAFHLIEHWDSLRNSNLSNTGAKRSSWSERVCWTRVGGAKSGFDSARKETSFVQVQRRNGER